MQRSPQEISMRAFFLLTRHRICVILCFVLGRNSKRCILRRLLKEKSARPSAKEKASALGTHPQTQPLLSEAGVLCHLPQFEIVRAYAHYFPESVT